MYAKVPYDAKCFHILGSTKTSPNIGVPFIKQPGKPDPFEKSREHVLLETPIWYKSSFCRVSKPSTHSEKRLVVPEIWTRKHSSGKNDKMGHVKDISERGINGKGSENGVRDGLINGNRNVVKTHSECSTKWAAYGGCIPAILQALDTIEDLDEALRPWEERLSNKERSIILKEQRDWARAWDIFEWFKRKDCYELNVIHYNITIRIMGKARKWSKIKVLWCEMSEKGIEPINSTYGTLIDVCSKGGWRDMALVWLGRMCKQGMEPDEVTMGIVVQMYKKSGDFLRAEQYFRKWSGGKSLGHKNKNAECSGKDKNALLNNVCLSSYTYNTLIDMYGKSGQFHEASETFEQMLKEGIVPTTVTFNTMIHMYGNNGRLKEVGALMQKMEELQCLPDTRTYNILISLHSKHDNIDLATKYFKKMKETSLKPDAVTYRTLLYAYSIRRMVCEAEGLIWEMDVLGLEIDEYTQSALIRMYIEANRLEESWLWFRRFHLAGKMSAECYSANIDAYGERGHIVEAERVFLCCQELKKLTVLEFNVMIKAYGIAGNYDKACMLFDSMNIQGVVPDECSYNSLVQILACADVPHQAIPYLRKMKERGLVKDCIPFCVLISSFVKLRQLESAESLYEEMIACHVIPDIIVYGVLINAFADAGNVKKALSYVDGMQKTGLPGNAVIYNSLIKLYTKVGYLSEAEETYELLQSTEEGPDIYSSNCMIDLYSERSMVEQAEEIFQRLKRKGEANEFTFAMMLCMYTKIGRFEEALQIAKQMKELGLITDVLSYNNVLRLYAMDGRVKEAVGTFKDMVEAAIHPDNCTFKSLSNVLIKCGVSKWKVGELQLMVKTDVQNGLKAWVLALSSVVVVDDFENDLDL